MVAPERCTYSATLTTMTPSLDHINGLPYECVLEIIKLVDFRRPTAVLNCLHVCPRWRNIIIGDRILCARMAFECRSADAIIQFLRWAGNLCGRLDFDNIMRRQTMALTDKMRVVRFMFAETYHLHMAGGIISSIPILECHWLKKLRSINSFPHLKTLNVHLTTLNNLPHIEAPNIISLTLATVKTSLIHAEPFVKFLRGLQSLRCLSLKNIACPSGLDPMVLDNLDLNVGLPRLNQLALINILPSQYCVMRRLIAPSSPTVETTLSLITSFPLQELWPSVSLRNNTSLRVSLCPFHMGVKLTVEEPDVIWDFHELRVGSRVSTGPNHVDKIYLSGDLYHSDILQDAIVYADQTETVSLCAMYVSGDVIVPLSDEITTHRVIPWLISLPHPRNLILDSVLRPLIERGSEFLWSSLQSIEIRCRAHADTSRDDDQIAVDVVTHWLQDRTSGQPVAVELSGRRWQPDLLSVTALGMACSSVTDRRR